MLDKKSKIVLKALTKVCLPNNYCESTDRILTHCPNGFTETDLYHTLNYLHRKELVKLTDIGGSKYSIQMTYEGKNYNEFQRIKVKQFFLKSIFVPIVVAIITTLTTLLIKGLFSPVSP